jgi:ATP-binding cassette, subfamily G (WHITE), member 1
MMGFSQIKPFMILQIAFLKHALDGYMTFFLGFNRAKLQCETIYCYFENPRKLLEILELDVYIPKVYLSMIIILFTFHLAAFLVMRYRVKRATIFDQMKI